MAGIVQVTETENRKIREDEIISDMMQGNFLQLWVSQSRVSINGWKYIYTSLQHFYVLGYWEQREGLQASREKKYHKGSYKGSEFNVAADFVITTWGTWR